MPGCIVEWLHLEEREERPNIASNPCLENKVEVTHYQVKGSRVEARGLEAEWTEQPAEERTAKVPTAPHSTSSLLPEDVRPNLGNSTLPLQHSS